MAGALKIEGFDIHKGLIPPAEQRAMAGDIFEVIAQAPLFSPQTRWGKRMSVRMTSAGRYGWYSDRAGYRYIETHPDGGPWPPIPRRVLSVWKALVGGAREPDCCLINCYGENARMGLHQDRDEADFAWPVLSISLGDTCIFRMGGTRRQDPTTSMPLESGDVVVIGGAARLAFHGVDRIRFGSSELLPGGGRINLTLRVVD